MLISTDVKSSVISFEWQRAAAESITFDNYESFIYRALLSEVAARAELP